MSWLLQAAKILMNKERVQETAVHLSKGFKSAGRYAQDFNSTHFTKVWTEGNAGDIEAQFQIAECYYKGRGVTISLKDSILWYNRAAEGGHARAQCTIALMTFLGRGIEKNPSEAWMWLKLSMDQNDDEAQRSYQSLVNKISQQDRQSGELKASEFVPTIYKYPPTDGE